MGDKSVIVISDDEGVKQPVAPNEEEEDEALAEAPDWLPDGWIMEVYHGKDGTINRYYTSPVSDYTFNMPSEVLEYLFSGTDERILESKGCAAEKMLQKEQEWLQKGWVMEIRAGGEKMDKMYKFYVYSYTGVRLQSKEDVILYTNKKKVSECDTNGQCDITSEDNILAKVELHPSGLPDGWIKELVFRKTKDGLIRRDPYYTDPASSYTFRTLKSALSYLETGKISKHAFIQKISVHDLYSFDKSADLHESLRSRLTINGRLDQRLARSSRPREASGSSASEGNLKLETENPPAKMQQHWTLFKTFALEDMSVFLKFIL
ncbi:uncharacterized protein LOC133899503 [Phragmites australis]|uniref:uncharacterized protein LOC133899503 n=1 Tax=Phragmites australis TaxID=29695 RepID=UPI002D78F34B|nr:uncharacterized protein LOC133899503 [Phragmites australis]